MSRKSIDSNFLLVHNKEHKKFKLEKGMQVNIYGYKYKVQAIKPNGNLKLKFLHYDVAEMKQTHVGWAEYFEGNPVIEKGYVATGEWDTAEEHRNIVNKYDKVLNILEKIKEAVYYHSL